MLFFLQGDFVLEMNIANCDYPRSYLPPDLHDTIVGGESERGEVLLEGVETTMYFRV